MKTWLLRTNWIHVQRSHIVHMTMNKGFQLHDKKRRRECFPDGVLMCNYFSGSRYFHMPMK